MKTYEEAFREKFNITTVPYEKGVLVLIPLVLSIETSGGNLLIRSLFAVFQYVILFILALCFDIIIGLVKILLIGFYTKSEETIINGGCTYKKKYTFGVIFYILKFALYTLPFLWIIKPVFGKTAPLIAIILVLILSVIFIYFLIKSGNWQLFYTWYENLFEKLS